METVLNWIYVGVAVLVLFGASIFVHEYGHFWMARRRGMKIDGFSIGFGPKIVSWLDRHGVEWALRWIPAGGFVKLPQMITSEAIEGRSDAPLAPISPVTKILVAVAGPFMNVVFALLLASIVWAIGLPVLVNPSVIGRVEPDSVEGKLGVRSGDRIVAINGHPVKSWQEINLEVVTALTNVIAVTVERGAERLTVGIPTKTSEALGLKWLDLEPQERPVIGLVQPNMPAAAVGLLGGDKILSFDGIYVLNQEHLSEIVNRGQGRACEIVIERAGERKTLQVTPVFDPETKRGRIGIGFAGGHYEIQRPGPTPRDQIEGVLRMMGKTFWALFHPKQTGVSPKDMSGPAGILGKLAVDVQTDYRLALSFMVMLNINLALLNLMPLPVLDGGHITMALYELILRRRVSVRFQEYATTVFAVLLLSFMAYVSFFDVRRLPLFLQMFKQKPVIEESAAKPAPVVTPRPAQ
jgi:regulator of sigma E protease